MKLFLHEPTVIFAARVNQSSFSWPMSQITYDTVTTGAYTAIGNSQTILFGSSAGASDLGSSRIRLDPTSTVIYFGLSSQGNQPGEVNPVDNCYITVIDTLLVFSKVPYIAADGTVYQDGDIAYTNQNVQSPPKANAGSPFVATIDSGTGVITVNLSAADSFATASGATITDYLWAVGAGGTIVTGDVDTQDIEVEYEAGFRYCRLTVTDSNSKTHNCYVPILAIDPADDPTIDAFQITRHTVTPEGQDLDIRLLTDVSTTTFPRGGMLIVIDGEPADGSDRENILFYGWADTEDAQIDAGNTGLLRDTTIHCLDVAGRLKQLPGYSQVLTHVASPTKWAEASFPNLDFMLWWLLYWQSTALALADFTWSGTSTAFAFAELFADGSNLWDQVARKAQSMLPDRKLVCNRRGQLAVKSDPMIMETGSRPLTTQANLSPDDYTALSFTQHHNPRVYWLRSNALQASNSTVTPLFAIAPGTSPGQGGAEQVLSENLAVSQTTLNQATGHHYARLNAPQGMFTVTLAGSGNLSFDPARMDWVALTISASVAAQRGLAFDEARFLLHQLDIRYNYDRGGLTRTNTLRLERETSGTPAVTYIPPAADPVDTGDFVPDDTAPTPPGFDGGLPSGVQNIALITDDGRYIVTNDFQSSPPTWTVDNSIQGNFSGDGMSCVVDPFSSLYRTGSGTVDIFYATTERIYKVTDIFGTPAETSLHTFAESITTAGGRWRTIAASFGRYQPDEDDNPWIMCVTHYNDFGTKKGTYCIYSVDGGQTWSSEIQITAERPTGSLIGARYWPAVWLSPRTPGFAVVVAKSQTGAIGGTQPYFTTDWGATWSVLTNPAVVTSPQATDGGLAGGGYYVPWESNVDETTVFHGYEVEESAKWERYLYKTVGSSSTDVTPSAGNYGPRRGLFSVRAFDGNSQYMVAVLANSGGDDDITAEESAVFVSDDYGATWDLVLGPTTTAPNTQYPTEAAFSADSEQIIYVYGNEAMIQYSTDRGATFEDKRGSLVFTGGELILGLVGG